MGRVGSFRSPPSTNSLLVIHSRPQFGFCTLYTTALPITPILALVNNIFEVRVDAKKQLNVFQRATPSYATNISVWWTIFRILSFAGVLMTGSVTVHACL